MQPLELDDVVVLEAPEISSSDWRPARAFLHAGFPDGIEPYCDARPSRCASEFFPEALALYLLDPAWVQDNHPELYARVQAYARRPRPDALKGEPQQVEMRESAR